MTARVLPNYLVGEDDNRQIISRKDLIGHKPSPCQHEIDSLNTFSNVYCIIHLEYIRVNLFTLKNSSYNVLVKLQVKA